MVKAYLPLARKYRPSTFAELVGQDSTAIALANSIELGREPHAVIFSGVRGIGKTTTARLYAKALNCDLKTSSEPCNKCESCRAIALGNHEDVVEIDGASNTSVDNIRSLRETISYVPQRSKFKVYIIDEVHMLSQSAFNALLKTLEEPPSHVIFVFATTELGKIPQTILSRCQVYYLKKLSLIQIRDRLKEILLSEEITFDESAISIVAREGHGSMRDSLTLLDHAIALGNGKVTVDTLSKIVPHTSTTPFINLLSGLISRAPQIVLTIVQELVQSGIEFQTAAETLATLCRHASIARDIGVSSIDFKMLGFDDEEERALIELGKITAPFDLNRLFRTFVKCRSEMDGSAIDRFIFENYCLEWCLDPGILPYIKSDKASSKPNMDVRAASPIREEPPKFREKSVSIPQEQKLDSRASHATISVNQLNDQQTIQVNSLNSKSAENQNQQFKSQQQEKPAFPETWRQLVELWKAEKPLQARKLEEAHPIHYSAERIELAVPIGSYASSSLLKPDEQKKLKDILANQFEFRGILIVTGSDLSPKTINETITPPLPESLATENERDSVLRRARLEEETRNHPVTQDTIKIFSATIERIEIHDA